MVKFRDEDAEAVMAKALEEVIQRKHVFPEPKEIPAPLEILLKQ